MTDSFSALHPALTFCYFAAVLLLTMFVLHPVFLALSLLGALGYCALLRGWRSLWRTLGRLGAVSGADGGAQCTVQPRGRDDAVLSAQRQPRHARGSVLRRGCGGDVRGP